MRHKKMQFDAIGQQLKLMEQIDLDNDSYIRAQNKQAEQKAQQIKKLGIHTRDLKIRLDGFEEMIKGALCASKSKDTGAKLKYQLQAGTPYKRPAASESSESLLQRLKLTEEETQQLKETLLAEYSEKIEAEMRVQLEEEIKKKLKEKLMSQMEIPIRDRVAIELTNFYIQHLEGMKGTEEQVLILRDFLSQWNQLSLPEQE